MEKSDRMEHSRHELLSDLCAQAGSVLRECGIDGDIADHVGIILANHLADHWGGQLVSFPRDYFFKVAKRDMEIYSEFRGYNYDSLARKYKMTTRAIYKIIDRVRRREFAHRQGRLFGDE